MYNEEKIKTPLIIAEVSNAIYRGPQGEQGKSAYQVALDEGFEGTEQEWLESLKSTVPGPQGPQGESALSSTNPRGVWTAENTYYKQDYVTGEDGNAYVCLEDNITGVEPSANPDIWQPIALKGAKGDDGKSAYELAVDNGFEGTETQWLASLKGAQGEPGLDGDQGAQGEQGVDGKSAYDLAVEAGFTGTLDDWLASLKGDKGDTGEQGIQGLPGTDGKDGEKGEKGDKGDKGDPGQDGAKGDKGDKGDPGPQGPKGADGVMTFEDLTPEQKEGLKGDKGDKGDQGEQGPAGKNGEKGEKGDPGADGAPGPQGPAGKDGEPGAKGDKGDPGEKGADGEPGKSGVYLGTDEPTDPDVNVWIDPDGQESLFDLSDYYTKQEVDDKIEEIALTPGPKGDKGDTGEQGPQGPQGIQGVQGIQGPAGANGSDYVITQADYSAIADVVWSKMTNAEAVRY